jgi:hypothetical protein
VEDDPVGAWERLLRERGRWRDDMREHLEPVAGELPLPDDVADHHGFELRPELPFPLSAPWFWEGEEDSDPDDERFDATRHGWLPLRHYGCGEYDVIVVTGPQAGHVWTLTDVGIACLEGEPRGAQLGWVDVVKVPPPPAERRDGKQRVIERIRSLVMEQRPPDMQVVRFLALDRETVRASAMRDDVVINVDVTPGARRKTYDALVHTFPVNRPRAVRTVERRGVPAKDLGALLEVGRA